MKKVLLIALAVLMTAGMAMAAKPAQKQKKQLVTTVFATDLDCDHCAKKILNNVPSLGKGVEDVKVDVATKEVTVVYDASKNSDENIVKGLASLKVKAEPRKEGHGPKGYEKEGHERKGFGHDHDHEKDHGKGHGKH